MVWFEGGKISHLGHLMGSHDAHTVANDTPVGSQNQWEQTKVPTN